MNTFSAMMLLSLTVLFMPLMNSISPNSNTKSYPEYVKTTISYSFMISLIPTIMFIQSGQEMMILNWHWMTIQTMKLSLSFKLDFFSMMFVPIALFITWSIMEFSMWYMHSDPNISRFFKYLLMFHSLLMLCTTEGNL